jgi:hypothetical protein
MLDYKYIPQLLFLSLEAESQMMDRKSYIQIQADFDQALQWYGSYVPRALKRRFAKYQQNIVSLVNAYKAGKIEELLKSISEEELTNSLAEASELVAIYKGLSPISGQKKPLTQLIREIVDGPEYAKQEDPSRSTNDARNFAFQMLIASYCAASGFRLDLENVADLAIEDNGDDIFIEAKRPTTYRNVPSNVNRALKQLTQRYEASTSHGKKRGFIALSISKIINHEQKLLAVKNETDLSRQLNQIVEKFIRKHEHFWQKAAGAVDTRTIGVIVHFSTAALLESENIIVTCQQLGLNNMTLTNHIIGSSDDNYFMEIGRKLHRGMEALYGHRVSFLQE